MTNRQQLNESPTKGVNLRLTPRSRSLQVMLCCVLFVGCSLLDVWLFVLVLLLVIVFVLFLYYSVLSFVLSVFGGCGGGTGTCQTSSPATTGGHANWSCQRSAVDCACFGLLIRSNFRSGAGALFGAMLGIKYDVFRKARREAAKMDHRFNARSDLSLGVAHSDVLPQAESAESSSPQESMAGSITQFAGCRRMSNMEGMHWGINTGQCKTL